MKSFKIGAMYFIVWYQDQEYLYPSFESVIFVGTNLLSDDLGQDAWFFQDLESYLQFGIYPGKQRKRRPAVHLHKFHRVDIELVSQGSGRVLDAAELIAEVSKWRSRIRTKRRKSAAAKTHRKLR